MLIKMKMLLHLLKENLRENIKGNPGEKRIKENENNKKINNKDS